MGMVFGSTVLVLAISLVHGDGLWVYLLCFHLGAIFVDQTYLVQKHLNT